jgi:hypothetical protein
MDVCSRDISNHPRLQSGEEIVKHLVLMAAIFFAHPLFAQDVRHAPTVAQCQADATLWKSQADEFFLAYGTRDTRNMFVMKLTAKELHARSGEMGDCAKVDVDRSSDYFSVASSYFELFAGRMNNFLTRHDLMGQFYQEDEGGAR